MFGIHTRSYWKTYFSQRYESFHYPRTLTFCWRTVNCSFNQPLTWHKKTISTLLEGDLRAVNLYTFRVPWKNYRWIWKINFSLLSEQLRLLVWEENGQIQAKHEISKRHEGHRCIHLYTPVISTFLVKPS